MFRRVLTLLAFLLFITGFAFAIGINVNLTVFSSCANNVNDSIVLSNNVTGNGTCFRVTGDDLVFDCDGRTITGDRAGYGINVTGRRNVTIQNCIIQNFSSAIFFEATNESLMRNNTLLSNAQHGAHISAGSFYNRVENNTLTQNSNSGAYLEFCSFNNVTNNSATSNFYGFYARGANNTLVRNTAEFNGNGFYLYSSSGTALFNNSGLGNTGWDFYSGGTSDWNYVINFTTISTELTFVYEGSLSLKYYLGDRPPDPARYRNISKYLNMTNHSSGAWLFLNISYVDSDWQAAGIVNDSSLRFWRHDGIAWSQNVGPENGVNTARKVVYANITSFSIFAPMGTTNIAPVMNTTRISPSPNATILDTLRGFCNATDPDSDPLYYHYRWFVNSTLNETGTSVLNYTPGTEENVANITPDKLALQQNWTFECTAYDGIDNSSAMNSTNTTIVGAPPAWQQIIPPEGVFEPYNSSLTGTHVSNFSIKFVGFTIDPAEVLLCDIGLPDSTMMHMNASGISVSEQNYSINYTVQATDPVIDDPGAGFLPWIVKNCSVYSGSTLVYTENVTSRIYVHSPEYWSDNEITRAVACEGTPGQYFNNTAKCEFTEDTKFVLQMRNGNPVTAECFNNPGVRCDSDYCRGIYFPTCDPLVYFMNYSQFSDDPNGYANFTVSFAGYETPIQYTMYTNTSSGNFKLRLVQALSARTFSITIYNLSNVSSANVYGYSTGGGTVFVTGEQDGTWNVAYNRLATGFTGTLDLVLNVSFSSSMEHSRTLKLVLAYGPDTNQGTPAYFPENFSFVYGLRNSNESENTSVTTEFGGTCGDRVNNDFNYIGAGGAWDNSYDCYDPNCDLRMGDYDQTNEFGSGNTGFCNYLNETMCTDMFDNDYNDYTDCHDADCFHIDAACPLTETICNDSINNDWDYVNTNDSQPYRIGESGHNGLKYNPANIYDLTDCEDPDCNGLQGGTATQFCNWGYETVCNDSFNNDFLQLTDCNVSNLSGATDMPAVENGEYDCSGYCRASILAVESGVYCDNNIDDDFDAVSVTGYYSGTANTTYGAGTDCRWIDYNPDEDCNMTFMSSGKRCELAHELTCNDSFDNDFDADAPAEMRPSPNWSSGAYNSTFNQTLVQYADYDDYDCQYSPDVPDRESINASWCFDDIDNDMDKYYWNGTAWALNSSGGIDCGDPDCQGTTNPADPGETCLYVEYNETDPFFTSLPNPGMYCENSFDDDANAYLGWPLGGTDCTDPNCNKHFGMCQGPCYIDENVTWGSCKNGIDDNYDMPTAITDCEDATCLGMIGASTGAFCQATELVCDDNFDNDANGLTDCADPSCNGRVGARVSGTEVYCAASETTWFQCFDTFDNDRDSYIDCYETSCNLQCELSTVSGLTPITLPQMAGQTSINSVTDAYIQDYTRRIRLGQTYNITFKMTTASTDAQWTLGTASAQFGKSYFDTAGATLSGPNAANFTLEETPNGFRIGSNHASLPAGYEFSFLINSTGLVATTYELTYAEETGSKTSLNNLVYHEVVENTPPAAQSIQPVPLYAPLPYGSTVYLRANASDNTGMGLCSWRIYGPESFSPADSTQCRAFFNPVIEGTYTINVTPVDYYSNIGSPLSVQYDLNIVPAPLSITLNKSVPFFNSTANESVYVNATFAMSLADDALGACEVVAKDDAGAETILGSFSATDASCAGSVGTAGLADGKYRLFVRATETSEGDIIDSNSTALFACSQISEGICIFADFNSDARPDFCALNETSMESSRIYPSPYAGLEDDLLGFCKARNPAGGNVTYYYRWFVNSTENETGRTPQNNTPSIEINVDNITSGNLSDGQNWTLECKADDGIRNSSALNSTVTHAVNDTTVPVINAIFFSPSTPTASTLFIMHVNATDDTIIDRVWAYIDGTNYVLLAYNPSSGLYENSAVGPYAAGNYPVEAFANDSSNNTGNGTTTLTVTSGGGPPPECLASGLSCARNSECCSGNCYNGVCISGACLPGGDACSYGYVCCSGICLNGVCLDEACEPGGISCTADYECCSGECRDNLCVSETCGVVADVCAADWQCCFSECEDGECACLRTEDACTANSQCCSGDCEAGFCTCSQTDVACASDLDCCTGFCNETTSLCEISPTGCVPLLGGCNTSTDCCTGFCNMTTQLCRMPPTTCFANNTPCSLNSECCSNFCNPFSSTCTEQPPCIPSFQNCTANWECCLGICNSTTHICQPPGVVCAADGLSCNIPADCCSRNCVNNVCIAAPKPPPGGGEGGGGESGGAAGGGPPSGGANASFECRPVDDACFDDVQCCSGNCVDGLCVNSTCRLLGMDCKNSAECCDNACLQGVCVLCKEAFARQQNLTTGELGEFLKRCTPCRTKTCLSSSQCCEGYCSNKKCITSIWGGGTIAILGIRIESGCDAVPELAAFGICDFAWPILLLLCLLAAYSARKEKNKLVPIAVFILPLIVSVLTLSMLGIFAALLEIIYFYGFKPVKK